MPISRLWFESPSDDQDDNESNYGTTETEKHFVSLEFGAKVPEVLGKLRALLVYLLHFVHQTSSLVVLTVNLNLSLIG